MNKVWLKLNNEHRQSLVKALEPSPIITFISQAMPFPTTYNSNSWLTASIFNSENLDNQKFYLIREGIFTQQRPAGEMSHLFGIHLNRFNNFRFDLLRSLAYNSGSIEFFKPTFWQMWLMPLHKKYHSYTA